jgi:transcriptional regulator with XRE-family HTH domain
MARNAAPLVRILQTYGIRRIELAAAAGVNEKTVARLCRGEYASLKVGTLARVAVALGVAPAELVPGLAARPKSGGMIGGRRDARIRQRS